MAMPREMGQVLEDLNSVAAEIGDIPGTPTEADLPAIITAVSNLTTTVQALVELIKTTRINQ